jgi:hypothetical protein
MSLSYEVRLHVGLWPHSNVAQSPYGHGGYITNFNHEHGDRIFYVNVGDHVPALTEAEWTDSRPGRFNIGESLSQLSGIKLGFLGRPASTAVAQASWLYRYVRAFGCSVSRAPMKCFIPNAWNTLKYEQLYNVFTDVCISGILRPCSELL